MTSGATPTTTGTPKPPPPKRDYLRLGDRGREVLALQQRLSELGYWLGEPDGGFGFLTPQAVWALQKSAGLGRDGEVGRATRQALADGIRPRPQLSGDGVDIGGVAVARTPKGTFTVDITVDGPDEGRLGTLWRPRYFNGGIAVHGAPSIPTYPASHGCARVSNPAMDMIWAEGLMPKGSTVLVR